MKNFPWMMHILTKFGANRDLREKMWEGNRWFPIADAGHFGERWWRLRRHPVPRDEKHSVKVSLLIVQVPVQTERLNPKGTNPARKSLIVRPVPSRVHAYAYSSFIRPSARVRVHTWMLIQHDSDLTFECGTGSFCLPRTSTEECSASSLLLSSHTTPALSFALEGPKRDAQQK